MFPDLTRDDVFRIETARLWLRWPRAMDASSFVRLASDQDVAQNTTCLPDPIGDVEAHDFIIGARRANADGRAIVLAVAPRNDPAAFIGMVGVQFREASDLVLGYWLGKPYWGQGLMQEAIEAVLDMSFVVADAQALETPVRAGNVAARKVLARCGFPLPAPDEAEGRFAHARITRDGWLAARAQAAGRIALPQHALH